MDNASILDDKLARTRQALQNIRELPATLLKSAFDIIIPADRAPAPTFWTPYNDKERHIGLRACLLVWTVTEYKLVPREFQLESTIALMTGKDSLIDVGTGYGKTLCMVIPCLLAPESLAIIFSPLKRLQAVQVLEFTRYGIETIAINEDTPNEPELWKKISRGKFSALFVQPEQLFTIDGHLPRLARLMQDRAFVKLVKRTHVDEAHFIYSAGMAHYGLPAFRAAWGKLGEFRIKVGKGIPIQALSGTQPPHIKKAIIASLLFDEANLCSIKLSSNRPNIVYATHPIVGELSDFRNLDFLVPDDCPSDIRLPKTIVFHDDSKESSSAALHVDRRLHTSLQDKGIVRHYHGGMSTEYLTKVYEDFSKTDGGLDISDIEAVVQYGISRDVPSTLQRCGRGGRSSSGEAIFLIMYEPWALDIDLFSTEEDPTDPDFPNNGKLTKHATKIQRTGRAMIAAVQSKEDCLRGFWANYLKDLSLTARTFTTEWCCDRHPGSGFHIRRYFKGRFLYQDGTLSLLYGDIDEIDRKEILPPRKGKRPAGKKVRATKDRMELKSRLLLWRTDTHSNDPLASVQPPSFILDDKAIKTLAIIHPTEIRNTTQVVLALNEIDEWDQEWSKKILAVIRTYDKELDDARKAAVAQEKARQKRRKVEIDKALFQEESDRVRAETERRIQESAAQGSSRFANTDIRRNLRPRK
ncbi:hypothetical protein BDZ97DRAFT_1924345 [Flammula alnicola]|nr:hypothetical protein BDZ97DRAFT_1924345 [Flammula alnicola]